MDNSTNRYRNPLPYPEVRVVGPNCRYAQILMEDYSSAKSEFTAIAQYLYHNLMSSGYQDVADMLLGIAEVEMEHLHMLGEAIVLLGGCPKFAVNCPNEFWCGDNVDYGHGICDRLRSDLNAEYGAIAQYREHIAMIDDPYIKNLLGRIILDEQVHIENLTPAVSRYCSRPCPCYC